MNLFLINKILLFNIHPVAEIIKYEIEIFQNVINNKELSCINKNNSEDVIYFINLRKKRYCWNCHQCIIHKDRKQNYMSLQGTYNNYICKKCKSTETILKLINWKSDFQFMQKFLFEPIHFSNYIAKLNEV